MNPKSGPGMTLNGTGVARKLGENTKETGGYTNHENVEVLPSRTLKGNIKKDPAISD